VKRWRYPKKGSGDAGVPLAGSELPLHARGAEEHEFLVGAVVDPSRLPALLVGGQPSVTALDASGDAGDLFGAHERESKSGYQVSRSARRSSVQRAFAAAVRYRASSALNCATVGGSA
jgi:hypothetical protein